MADVPSAPTLRPMSVADLIDETFRLYRRNFGLLFALSALLWLPGSILSLAGLALMGLLEPRTFGDPTVLPAFDLTSVSTFGLGFLVLLVTFPMLLGATALAVSDAYLGRPTALGDVIRSAARSVLKLIAAYALIFLALILAIVVVGVAFAIVFSGLLAANEVLLTLLLVLVFVLGLSAPLVWIAVTFSFVTQTIVLERVGVFRGLLRSAALARGARWRIVGISLLLLLIGAVLFSVPSSVVALVVMPVVGPSVGFALGQLASIFAQVLFNPIQFGTITLLYYDMRIRKEAFDLALAAERLLRS